MVENMQSEVTNQGTTNITMPCDPFADHARYAPGIVMTHSAPLREPASPTIITRGINFGARTAEQTRLFANNISSAIEGIEPLIERARIRSSVSLGSLLNIQRNPPQTRIPLTQSESAISRLSNDNYIANIEAPPASNQVFQENSSTEYHHHQMTITNNPLNTVLESEAELGRMQSNNSSNNSDTNSNTDENSTTARIRPEVFKKFIPFILILVAKGLYDHSLILLNSIAIILTFDCANAFLKREIARQQNRSWASLFIMTCYIVACILFFDFQYDLDLFSYTECVTLGELLWHVFIIDYILKLITIIVKIAFTCLPARLIALRKRGKYYLMIEATSQLYRAIMPIGPWLYYLFDGYQGTERVVGIFLSTVYIVSKVSSLLSNVKLFHKAVRKLFQDVSLGVSPSKEQIVESGGICAICHEEYSVPVLLRCTHIFCEACITTWLDRERSCPLCRVAITDHPIYRDGQTTNFIQFY